MEAYVPPPVGAYDPFRQFAQPPSRVKKLAILGHSFVAGGGGVDPSTFAAPLAAALRAKYGDAGAGYVPMIDGRMAGLAHSTNFIPTAPLGPSGDRPRFRWDSSRAQACAFNGMGYVRLGGSGGTDGFEYVLYQPSIADSFGRGDASAPAYANLYFTLLSDKAGFMLRQSDQPQASGGLVSGGAAFTGSVSGTSLTAASVSGLIPFSGVEITGGVSAGTSLTADGGGGGGAGLYQVSASQTVGSTAMSVPGNLTGGIEAPQKIGHRLDPAHAGDLQILGVYGDVAISGIESFNGQSGVTITDFGVAGASAYQWASLDDAAQRGFWRLAGFDQVILVLNLNDRADFAADQHAGHLAAVIARIQACAQTRVLIARETDPSDAASTHFPDYDGVLRNLAAAMGCGYVDERACPGFADFATADAAGLMAADGVHRSGAGNSLMAQFYADRLDLR